MNLLFRKISLFLSVLVFVFISIPSVNAQDLDLSSGGQLPSVYVQDLNLLRGTDYNKGDLVAGSFNLVNGEDKIISNVYYEVQLVGKYQTGGIVNGIPAEIYDRKSYGPISLLPQESKSIYFEHPIMQSAGGSDIGIQVQAKLESGQWLGWDDVRIKVAGELSFLNTSDYSLKVNADNFGFTFGPTLKPTDQASINLKITNPGTGAVTVTPIINIYRQTVDSEPILNESKDKITLSPGQTVTFTYDLPKFDSKPAVYVGTLDFLNESAESLVPRNIFRYIMGGNIVAIQTVDVDRTSVEKGENVSVTVTYSGTPADITLNAEQNRARNQDKVYSITTEVWSEKGVVVGRTVGEIKDIVYGDYTVSVPVEKSSRSIAVSVIVKDGENVIAQYETVIPRLPVGSGWTRVYLAIITVLALAVIIFFFRRKNKVVFTLVLLSLFGLATGAQAATISISSPASNAVYSPGASANLNFSISAATCANDPQTVITYYQRNVANCSANASDYTYLGYAEHAGGGSKTSNFSRSFNVSNSVGTYKVCVFADVYQEAVAELNIGNCATNRNSSYCTAQRVATVTGNKTYSVANPAVNGSCGSATSSPSVSMPTSNLCTTGTASTTPASANNWNWNCNGTNGGTTASCSAPISGPLSVTCSVSPQDPRVGELVTWSASTTGGSGAFTYSWTGTDDLSGNTISVGKVYTTTGLKRATTTVTRGTETVSVACPGNFTNNGGGSSTTSGGGGVEILPAAPLSGSCAPNPASISTGQTTTWTAYPSGGVYPYTYAWNIDAQSFTTQTVNRTYNTAGTKTATVQITDSSNPAQTTYVLNCSPLSVDALPADPISCSIIRENTNSTNSVPVNTNTVWKVVDTNDDEISSSYSRNWEIKEGNSNFVSAGSADKLEKIFTTVGLKEVKVSLISTNAEGVQVIQQCSVNGSTATTSVVLPGSLEEI